ncbi:MULTISPECIES: DUF2202 domain-containing protein [Catenuloplanes]|uniref:DUF2202 domain-containing protein n=1 Tax=Catenuloplanes niger TaxID=587534 RepID=A0AAE3ZXD3_9ACTN|nr:DUF2202 domain-containing protein [Catenuloplanes niger]MDR7327652.1 hypothetical protein [Catenuloplanes niger]
MRIVIHRTATFVTAGALMLGGPAVAVPALAGNGPSGPGPAGTATAGPGHGMGYGAGLGHDMGYGLGRGDGACPRQAITAAQGTLTAAQKTTLASMAQEEKLAHDLYAAFAISYDAAVFDHFVAAEARHLDAIRVLLRRYGVADPTTERPAGSFSDGVVQGVYDGLLARGGRSLAAALAVGQRVERDDIAALRAARDGLTAPDVTQAYTNLLAASERQLAAFTRWAAR